jgi:hypothetical protein
MFEDEELWGKPSTDHLYREMLYIIIYARQKYKDIANNIENICKQKTKEVLKLLNDILIVRSLRLRPDEKDIINYCLSRDKPGFSLPFNSLFIFSKIKQT